MLEFWADPDRVLQAVLRVRPPHRRVLRGGLRSALAADTLKTLGFTDVGHIEGGFGAWKAAGLPVEDVEQR